ncbi:MAG: hypothetical protein OEZ65_02685 [Gemmatimonadota bacterium]|nr:hypothetical protein [Gemmatimonadota bacterium]MDH5758469.1 hypothetical protein [Gemmatimonadota bacterium]
MTSTPLLAIPLALVISGLFPGEPLPWGQKGHEMVARVAARALPAEVPAFFRDASDQLAYLNPEPDRWRSREFPEMDGAWSYDHYIDLENVPEGALDAANRYAFLAALNAAGVDDPHQAAGFVPYRIVELYERLVTEWRLWRAEGDPARREWIAQRIVQDAGVLGHYVADVAQPHHTTIHFNGWDANTPNPEGFTQDREFHYRFETAFVGAHVAERDIRALARERAVRVGEVRPAVMDYVRASHAEVETLYRIDRDVGFDPDAPADASAVHFAAERLAAGADMLSALWWSAWLQSGER